MIYDALESPSANNIYELNCTKLDLSCISEYLNFKSMDESIFEGFEHLEELNLSGNKLQPDVADQFKPLVNLKRLDLSHCKIRLINKDFFNGLRNLVYLNLSNNKIEFFIAETFDPLVKLATLDLNMNEIKLKKIVFKNLSNLKVLKIKLKSIDDCKVFEFTKELKELHLNMNHCDHVKGALLESLRDLEKLNWKFCQIDFISKANFKNLNKIKELELVFDEENQFSYEDYENFKEKFDKNAIKGKNMNENKKMI
jgi:Leucine-rich repeat (LRR) protein